MAEIKTVEYLVDDEPQTTTEKVLTAKQILTNAGRDLDSYYLVQIEGNHKTSYQNSPDEEIHMHPKMKFISVYTGETPVS